MANIDVKLYGTVVPKEKSFKENIYARRRTITIAPNETLAHVD